MNRSDIIIDMGPWGREDRAILPTPNLSKTPLELFKEIFNTRFGENPLCVEECLTVFAHFLQNEDDALHETGRNKILSLWQQFENALNECHLVDQKDKNFLSAEVKEHVYLRLQSKWVSFCAKSFNDVLSLSDNERQIAAAQQWTDDFFTRVVFFQKFMIGLGGGTFVAKLEKNVSDALHGHLQELKKATLERIGQRMQRDPVGFGQMMELVDAKLKDNPASLSSVEKEYVEFGKIAAQCITMYYPDIDKKKELLKKCIWGGFTLQQMKIPIINYDVSRSHFKAIFAENSSA